jgi:hypothetical protein
MLTTRYKENNRVGFEKSKESDGLDERKDMGE